MNWNVVDLSSEDVGSWEPSYNTELWKKKNIMHLFVEKVIPITSVCFMFSNIKWEINDDYRQLAK